MEIGRTDLSLARLAEAHWDAIAILSEGGRIPTPEAVYGVWAAEIPGEALTWNRVDRGFLLSGKKMFCSGAGLVDRALVTTGSPDQRLFEVNLRKEANRISYDNAGWKTIAFAETKTAKATFNEVFVPESALIGEAKWYLNRPGFWHGACGPAACWAGGAAGLVDYANRQARNDPHTLAHLGAMRAQVWGLESLLDSAGREIDAAPYDSAAGHIRALCLRHLVEQSCTDVMRRLARAYGPHPITMDQAIVPKIFRTRCIYAPIAR